MLFGFATRAPGNTHATATKGDGCVIIRHPRSDVVKDALMHIVSLVKVV